MVNALNECDGVTETATATVSQHLRLLESALTSKKGDWVEVEINAQAGKVIVRDNLNTANQAIHADYSPVLGFNRLCVEGD